MRPAVVRSVAVLLVLLGWCTWPAVGGTDWTVGIFTRDRNSHVAGGYLYPTSIQVFIISYLKAHADARVAIVTDDETAGHLYQWCGWDFARRCTLLHVDDALAELKVGAFVRRSSVYVKRHFLNDGALHILWAHRLSSGLTNTSLVLLSDVRDVVFEHDLFARLRARPDALQAGEEPLYFAMEPYPGPIRDQLWNYDASRQCLPPATLERFASMPMSCSGTTVGSVSAIWAYTQAMQQYTLFCSGPGYKRPGGIGGMDQPAHMLLLWTVIMSRRGEAGWAQRYGRMLRNVAPPQALPFPFHPSGLQEPAYRALYDVAVAAFAGPSGSGSSGSNSSTASSVAGHGRIVPMPMDYDQNEICTIGVLFPEVIWLPQPGRGYRFPLTAPSLPDCAVVHQYDRHDPLTAMYVERHTGMVARIRAPNGTIMDLEQRAVRPQPG